MITLDSRSDFTLGNYQQVAWGGQPVCLSKDALSVMDNSRQSFLELLDSDPDLVVYGVTSGYGQRANLRFSLEERKAHAQRSSFATSVAFGDDLPQRVTRGFVFARLTNFIEGHAAVASDLAQTVATMLDGPPLPPVPGYGIGCPGEIQPLGHLFSHLGLSREMGEKETLSLINGSPCASALVADVALSARRRLDLAYEIFALSIEALRAPMGAYDLALESLWSDPLEARAVQHLRELVGGGTEARRSFQAPVSWRILPRVLAQAERAVETATNVATTSLTSVTDNPVYIPPDADNPLGRVFSTGGYHNGSAYPAIDDVSASWADLSVLADRHISKLLDGRISHLPDQLLASDNGYLGVAGMAAVAFAEEARHAAQRSFLPGSEGGGFGQNDVGVPTFWSFRKHRDAARAFDALLAYVAAVSSQAFFVTDRQAPPALQDCLAQVRARFSPVTESRPAGPDASRLAQWIEQRVYGHSETV